MQGTISLQTFFFFLLQKPDISKILLWCKLQKKFKCMIMRIYPQKHRHINTYINNMRYSFEQIQKLAKSIIRHSTLSPEVVVISWDELVEWHSTLGVVFQEVHHFQGKLLCSLYLLWALI